MPQVYDPLKDRWVTAKAESEQAQVNEWLHERIVLNNLLDRLGAPPPTQANLSPGYGGAATMRIENLILALTPERLKELQAMLSEELT